MGESDKMILFHAGFDRIPSPDIRFGRKNADFGQGFYLSDNEEFSKRWARERRGSETILNKYELNTTGLEIKRFVRNDEWFEYIYKNRGGYEDELKEFDIIIGPIANDTIYDTWGITTSGALKKEQALALLTIGPLYEQIVIKTEKAAAQLRFLSAEVLDSGVVAAYRAAVRSEEESFQELFAQKLDLLTEDMP